MQPGELKLPRLSSAVPERSQLSNESLGAREHDAREVTGLGLTHRPSEY